ADVDVAVDQNVADQRRLRSGDAHEPARGAVAALTIGAVAAGSEDVALDADRTGQRRSVLKDHRAAGGSIEPSRARPVGAARIDRAVHEEVAVAGKRDRAAGERRDQRARGDRAGIDVSCARADRNAARADIARRRAAGVDRAYVDARARKRY